MGSGAGAVKETVNYLTAKDEKIGFVNVRLFLPFSADDFINAIPATVTKIAILDRTKEAGSIGEPLYQDAITAFSESFSKGNTKFKSFPKIIGGRYGLSSKEFTPAMVKAIFGELQKDTPHNHFTIGINDDVTHTSLNYDHSFSLEEQHEFRGLFYGLGADGTVGANKNSIKIIGETTDFSVQAYFVYDSKKSGALTTSHLRFGKKPITSTYLISSANFVACHQYNFLSQYDMLKHITPGGTFLLNAPFEQDTIWENIPKKLQEQIVEKKLKFYLVDAGKVAKESGMGKKINGILQTCFFAISGIMPKEEAIEKIKIAIAKTYKHKGEAVIQKNYEAVDNALAHLYEIKYTRVTKTEEEKPFSLKGDTSDFVKNVLEKITLGEGDDLPVSAFPVDGTFPSATTQYEKRNIAELVPVWFEDICTQCNKCVIICPHAAIRAKIYDNEVLNNAPDTFKHVAPIGKEFNKETESYTLQVAAEDCTGCGLCIEYCPVESKTEPGHKPIEMRSRLSVVEKERTNWDFFLDIPEMDRTRSNLTSVKGTQFLQPLFEFSSACPGCGETPYLKLLSQVFGERMIVANATGCSSIFGGNLPTTPWAKNKQGQGPAWANSLFEDNAEFGLGIRLAVNQKRSIAIDLLTGLKEKIGSEIVNEIILNEEKTEAEIKKQRSNLDALEQKCKELNLPETKRLLSLIENISRKSVWIVGGDGWAYDIGYGGLDHIFASGEKVNILVMDTEVYSNTGGQTSKATPIGAMARFSVAGKQTAKKNLALMAIAYQNMYVAQVALGANDTQTVRAFAEAEAFPGTSLIIGYSPCIAHGFDMSKGAEQQQNAVKSGYWPLFRYNPLKQKGERFSLDSKEPSIALKDYIYNETRYTSVVKQHPAEATELLKLAEKDVARKWEQLNLLRQM